MEENLTREEFSKLEHIDKLFEQDEKCENKKEENTLICNSCDFINNHIEKVVIFKSNDNYYTNKILEVESDFKVKITEEKYRTNLRCRELSIGFSAKCENCGKINIYEIGFHKGIIFTNFKTVSF